MLLLEEQSEPTARSKIQIFGTDILEHTVEQARAGTYSKAAVAGVSQARLKRFFVKTKQGYRIQKFVRDLCVFARHDLAQDPPFSRLDLIACRNVLIYMGPALQKRVLSIFQYALKPGGFLFLGNSESINDFSDSFAAEDRNHRIFVRKLTAPAFRDLISAPARFREPGGALAKANAAGIPASFRAEAEKILLGHYSPPALVVDPDLHIVHFQGDTSPYLAPATGQPSFHLLKMVRPELVVDLSSAIYKARKERATVRKDNVSFVHKGQLTAVRLEARPLKDRHGKWQHLLVVFRKVKPVSLKKAPTTSGAAGATKHTAHRLEKLERELASTREHLRAVITEYEAAQDEMKTANEEILSSNEEMQASNDELETAKEELQASNEELVTLNEELRHRNSELVVLTHELSNLLVGVDLPVVVLDAELRIRRFTPVAATALNLSASDVGRPFSKSASRLDVPDWEPLFSEVTKNGRLIEREVSDRKGHRYSLRLRPYQASENTAEGVLLVLLDTDLIYRARDQAQKSGEEYARAIVETIHEALVVADSECRVLTVNRSFCRLFQVTPESMERKSVLGTGAGQFARPKLRELILEVFSKNKEIQDLELVQDFPEIGLRDLVLNARRIDTAQAVLIAITDVTERKRAQKELERSESTIRTLLDSSPQSVVAMDAGAKIMLVNANTEKMFGYRREELLGQPLERLVPAHRLMGSGVDLEGHRKDGSTFPVEVGMSAIETAAGTWSVAFMSDITQRKHEEQASQLHAQEVRALAASLLTAQEEERRRVSRELHDQICQQLASLAIDIGGLAADPPPPEDARRRLKGLQARAVKASEGTRHIAYELHSSVLDDLGLVASLQSLCREFSEPSNLAVEFNSAVPSGSVPREVASCLNRIAQESLQNVAKHASAKHVSVALTLQNGTVVLTVEDDGVGFDVDAVKGRGGLGLISMEERARLINGKLSIATQMGRGTRVTLEVPVSR
jgi:PAS domain S-box-containing protein